jgi:HAD superfamily hydrolase (TIGR01509 family)
MSRRPATPSRVWPRCSAFVEATAELLPFAELTLSAAKGSGLDPAQRAGSRLRAVLFDAGNTLVFLDYARLAEGVGAALNLSLTGEGLSQHVSAATRAMEFAAGTDQARAAAYLEALFLLGGVPRDRLDELRSCLARMHRQRHLWSSVADRSAESLRRLRDAGLLLGVVSNSDGRVEEALQAAGLRGYFDVVIDSAVLGVEKPDPRIFQAALTALGVRPHEALYVGDLYEVDIVGARAAGMRAVLLGTREDSAGERCPTTESIEDLVTQLLSGESL